MYKKLVSGIKLLRNIASIKLGRPKPIIAVWETTYRCNMRCCFCNEKNLLAEEMDTAEALQIINQLARLGTNVILLTGGEPTLREDIDRIMDAIRKSGMTSIFTTNGFNVKHRLNTILKADLIRVSVDGYGDVHDAVRGVPGAFDRVSEVVPLLVKARKKPMLVCVVTSMASRTNLGKLLEQARRWKVQVDLSMVTYSMRTGRMTPDEEKVSRIQKESRVGEEEFLDMLDEFQRVYPDVVANPSFYRRLIGSGGLGKRCRAMDVSLNIRPNGKVSIPCDAFTLFEISGSVEEMWSRMSKLTEIKEKLGEYGFCSYCYKRCIAFPSMMLNFRDLADLMGSYLPTIKSARRDKA